MTGREPAKNNDELLDQIREDELADALELQTHMSPIEYARARGMKPQRVYYFIRNRRLTLERCACGRTVINIKTADEFFAEKDGKTDGAEGD